MLENTEGAIQKNWQHGCTQDEEKHNTICVGHHYTHSNTKNVNRTCVLRSKLS